MSLVPGTRIGPYEVAAKIGEGGMGIVYRALDTKLKRQVALKVLPATVTADAERLARFQREAEVLAALNHPNIAAIYGLEDDGHHKTIVMELVEGPTLADRIAGRSAGPGDPSAGLPIDEALTIAQQIAYALEAAHELGIVHRDLKPANIKVREDGVVKVLDFGLAKAMEPTGTAQVKASQLPTITSPALMTGAGIILGTAAYMSPEQAKGRPVDARADIWAFGCVFYEMLTGQRAFGGETISDVLASVLAREPDFSALPAHLHPRLRELLERCLAKDPKRRWHATGDVRFELERAASMDPPRAEASPVANTRGPSLWARLAWLAAAAVVASAATWLLTPAPDTDAFPMRAVLIAEDEYPIGPATLSPDHRSIVYPGRSRSGQGRALYLQRLDQLGATEVPGTNAPGAAAFSPDGTSIAFISNRRRLMKLPLDGGPAVTLGDVADDGGVDWSPSGDIVVGPGTDELRQGLFRVNEAGGPLTPFTRVDPSRKELAHQLPCVLDDGKTVLFTLWFGTARQAQIAGASLDNGTVVPLGVAGVRALGVVDGQLIYLTTDGVAMAVPFDVASLRVSGAPTPVQDSIRTTNQSSKSGDAFLTRTGGLVYLRGNENRRLVWVDRRGTSSPALDVTREYATPRLSPDDRRVAVTILTGPKSDLWTVDLAAGTLTPLTTTGVTRNSSWSPDGRRILYGSNHGGSAALWWQPADSSGPSVLASSPARNPWNIDLSPDGHTVAFNSLTKGTFDLESLTLSENANAASNMRELAGSAAAAESHGRFSPDGRWVAYQSDESGRAEVYTRSAESAGGRVAISAAGGTRPVWARDGTQLFFWEGSRIMAATLAFTPDPRVVAREPLFEGPYVQDYDVAKDGRFLMVEAAASGLSLVVVPNWRTELRRLTAGSARP